MCSRASRTVTNSKEPGADSARPHSMPKSVRLVKESESGQGKDAGRGRPHHHQLH